MAKSHLTNPKPTDLLWEFLGGGIMGWPLEEKKILGTLSVLPPSEKNVEGHVPIPFISPPHPQLNLFLLPFDTSPIHPLFPFIWTVCSFSRTNLLSVLTTPFDRGAGIEENFWTLHQNLLRAHLPSLALSQESMPNIPIDRPTCFHVLELLCSPQLDIDVRHLRRQLSSTEDFLRKPKN